MSCCVKMQTASQFLHFCSSRPWIRWVFEIYRKKCCVLKWGFSYPLFPNRGEASLWWAYFLCKWRVGFLVTSLQGLLQLRGLIWGQQRVQCICCLLVAGMACDERWAISGSSGTGEEVELAMGWGCGEMASPRDVGTAPVGKQGTGGVGHLNQGLWSESYCWGKKA